MISAGRPGTPASYAARSPAWRMTSSTSARALVTTSSMRPGWIRPSAMSLVTAIRAISRRTGSKLERMTVSGVSSTIRSTPVACSRARMLRPSRPMIRPFISSDGRWITETVCSAVWSAATRWIAVTTMSRARSWASSRADRSIARAIFTASCSASSRTASTRTALASSADIPDARSRAATCSCWARASSSRDLSSSRSRSRSFRSRCSSMSVRWSICSSRWSRRRSRPASSPRFARASSSASACIRSFSSFASRISSFWRARASASIRRASAWAVFIVWDAQMLRASTPRTAPIAAATRATATTSGVSIFSVLPSGRFVRPEVSCVVAVPSRGRGTSACAPSLGIRPWAAMTTVLGLKARRSERRVDSSVA